MSLRTNIWVKMFWAFGLILALTLLPVLSIKLVLHKTAQELAGPYFAFAMLQLIFLLVAKWLRAWEERGPSPKLLALCWSLSVAVFAAAIEGAFFYSGVQLGLLDARDNLGAFTFVLAASVLPGPFVVYYKALPVIIARARPGRRDLKS